MKNKAGAVVLLIMAILLQWYVMYSQDMDSLELPFSTALDVTDTLGGRIVMVLHSVIPIPFVLWVYSGTMKDISEGMGILFVIRHYSRIRLFMRCVLRMLLFNAVITGYFWVVFSAGKKDVWDAVGKIDTAEILILYWLVLTCTVLLEYFIELFLESQYAHLIVLIYFTCCIFTYDTTEGLSNVCLYRIAYFPVLAFAHYNGVFQVVTAALCSVKLCFIIAGALLAGCCIKLYRKDII